ncbi:MAG: cadherin-like beta sandwich domain-containing protein [Prevotellaceae bacterium]|jgi:hypothetical protein|nr:cadherin-like beta sandwich domain-containing protein [Prevotellaceae bacterium]
MKRLFLFFIMAIVTPWALAAATPSPFPQLSESGTEHYYTIFSHRATRVLKNNGVDSLITSVKLAENDSLKWKFVRVQAHPDSSHLDTFKIVSKLNGEELYYQEYTYVGEGKGTYLKNPNTGKYELVNAGAGDYSKLDRFVTASAGNGSTFVFKHYKDEAGFIFQIWCVDAAENGSFVNMTNNTAPKYNICVYSVNNDGGNPFSAVNSKDDFGVMYQDAPQLSTSGSPMWYQLQFVRGGKVVTSKGENSEVLQEARIEAGDSSAQMFRMEGDYLDGFKVICMVNNMEMKYNEVTNSIILVASGTGDFFLFTKTPYPEYWQLKHVDKVKFINETQGKTCLYGVDDDAGNRFRFIEENYDPYAGAPSLSTADAPKWHYLKNSRANRVLKFRGLEEQIYTEALAEGGVKQDSQLFRFEGSYKTGFKIIGKLGGELKLTKIANNDRFIAAASAGDLFKVEKSANLDYGTDKWGIWHSDTENGLNAHNAKVDEVTTYNISDAGSVWEFIHVSRQFTISVNDAAKGSVNKGSGLFVDSSEIVIVATPKPHFGLDTWTLNGVNIPATSDTLALKLDSSITLVANFKGNDTLLNTLTVTANDGKSALFPAFDPQAAAQTARVPSSVQSIRIEATPGHELSVLTGDTGTFTLTGNSTAYTIAVAAENGKTKTYTITVLRAQPEASSDAALTITGLAGSTVSTPADSIIMVSIPSDSGKVTIAASVASGAVFAGTTGTFELAADRDSALTFEVLAADYQTSKTYTVILHHQSKNAYLKTLAITLKDGNGTNLLSPSFTADRVSYTATLSKGRIGAAVDIAAIAQNSYATVEGTGAKTLAGADTFRVKVTPEEGTQAATYTIVMKYLNNDATLKSLTIAEGALSGTAVPLTPEFAPTVTEYTARTASVTVLLSAVATDGNAAVNPARQTVTLIDGNNPVQVKVKAEDEETEATYTIVITRGEPLAVAAIAEGSLAVYPNPVTNGTLTIDNGDLKAGERIELYSLAGNLAATCDASAGAQTTINVSSLPKGAYIVKLGKRTAKVVVK